MALQGRIGVAVAAQAEAMEACFDSDFEIGAVAAMAMDAAVEPSAIGIVMVAGQTVDGRMLGMIEVQGQHLCTGQQRLTECDVGAADDERAEREHRGDDGTDDEGRMTAEDEAAHGGLGRYRADAAPAPEEHREAACGYGDEQDAAAATSDISARRDHVDTEKRQQKAAEYDVRRLKVSVAMPETPAHRRQRGYDQYEEHGEAYDSRQLVQRRRGFQILDDRAVGHHRQKDMERGCAEGDPAQHFVAAERKQSRRRRLPRPHGAAAQGEAGERSCKPQNFRAFPAELREAGEDRQGRRDRQSGGPSQVTPVG